MSNYEPGTRILTPEQVLATASPHRLLYIEAFPGSGKTTVSNQRFGLHRYARTTDHRAVVAVSFTRSATEEIRSRVSRQWGPSSLTWPHRIVTLDTILNDLLAHLLRYGILHWPGGRQELEVLDTWRSHLPTTYILDKPVLALNGTRIVTDSVRQARRGSYVKPDCFASAVGEGRCTHDNVREVLQLALRIEGIRASVVTYFATTIRSLLVDEVYDANDLDLGVIRLAANAGLVITLVGDPWQALYGFRGARPENVPRLLSQLGFERSELQTSFRWRGSAAQTSLARQLRRKERAVLPAGQAGDVDVVLARQWKLLWDADPHILPLAVRPKTGQFQEAVCTLLLNELAQSTFGRPAVDLIDARTSLGIMESDTLAELRPHLRNALERLAGQGNLVGIWTDLAAAMVTMTPVEPSESQKRTPRAALANLRTRLEAAREGLVPGMTCHQAKGREWDRVGVRLEEADTAALRRGLDPTDEAHRALYVALTRARHLSLAV
ncbi:UvrD-helicase domain-containing protein [Streptomyces sp. DSM 41524]|uniref:UvrD-helicase domain-containing protein n=1 Tax=Streptomyces asiaticus subsp. ignotus TaxID=3098222 RepID=A0ABU7QE71_9ACTN|nr:UvrD-helicase domain-containing protein [Streptomyces sp. DSM 41524]